MPRFFLDTLGLKNPDSKQDYLSSRIYAFYYQECHVEKHALELLKAKNNLSLYFDIRN
jgi:hypothetical protein